MYHSAIPGPDESVRYLAVGETQWVYRGGSRSWRTHNPGELRHSLLAVQHGSIGQAGGVAVFPTRAAGRRALDAQLASRDFAYLSLEQVCRRFDPDYRPLPAEPPPGPPADGPPPAPVCPHTGLEATRLMNDLDEGERGRVASAIEQTLIGWREGTITEEPLAAQRPEPGGRPVRGGGLVLINGRSAVHAGSGGRLSTPDVCRTPTPGGCQSVLYANVAESADAEGTAGTVFINGHPVCIASSRFARSRGDEGGRCGGVRSGTTAGPAHFLTASGDVLIEGEGAVRQYDLMVSNNRNTAPMPLMQPGAPPPPEVLAAALRPGEETPGPNALRLELGPRGAHHLPATLVARAGDRQRPIALPSAASRGGAEALVIDGLPEGARPDLLLRLPGPGAALELPLAEVLASQPFDPADDPRHSVGAGAHVLAAVRFARPGEDPADPPRPLRAGGRLYIFREGTLWRELAVTPDHWVREVDLPRWRAEDTRPAEAIALSHVLLPERLAGAARHYQIAYAEIPWTASRIAALEADAEARAVRCTELGPEALGARPDARGDLVVVLPDPLEEAREWAEEAQGLLELRSELETARASGTPAVAALVQSLLEFEAPSPPAHRDPALGAPAEGAHPYATRRDSPRQQTLADHIDRPRLERTLADWARFDAALTAAYPQAVAGLLQLMESAAFQAALSDYVHEGAPPRHRLLGAVHLAWLLAPASTPEARAFVARALEGAIPWLAEPDRQLTEDLRRLATGEQSLRETDPDLAALGAGALAGVAVRGAEVLDNLLQAMAEALLRQATDDTPQALERVVEIVQRYTAVEFTVAHIPAAALIHLPGGATGVGYQFRPAAQLRVMERLERVRITQIVPAENPQVPRSAEALREHPLYRRRLYGVLGVLHGVNGAVATFRLSREFERDTALAAGSALGGALAFYAERFQEIAERAHGRYMQHREALEGRLDGLTARHRRALARGPNGGGEAARLWRQRQLVELRAERLAVSVERASGRVGGFFALRVLAGSVAALADTALGARDLYRGWDRNNLRLAGAGASLAVAGLLAGVLVVASLPWLAVIAAGLGLVAGLVGAGSERRPLAQALRHGSFGLTPGAKTFEGFRLAEPEPLTDQALAPGITLNLADREPELDELYRLLYVFEAQVRLRPLYTTPSPWGQAGALDLARRPPASEVVVEGRIAVGAFDPGRSRLELEVVATGVGGAWGEPPSRRLTLEGGELLLNEEHDGERLRAVRVYARLTREACLGGVHLRARLDVDGSGRHQVPKNGGFVQTEAPRFLDQPVTAYEWRQIEESARELRHAKPAEEVR